MIVFSLAKLGVTEGSVPVCEEILNHGRSASLVDRNGDATAESASDEAAKDDDVDTSAASTELASENERLAARSEVSELLQKMDDVVDECLVTPKLCNQDAFYER